MLGSFGRIRGLLSTLGAVGLAAAVIPGAAAASGTGVARWGSYLGGTQFPQYAPTSVPGLEDVVSVAAGNSSNYALECKGGPSSCASDGAVMSWGNGEHGQLGDGGNVDSLTLPVHVSFPSGVHVVAIGEAKDDGFAIDSSGQGWAWGLNEGGSLCLGKGNAGVALAPTKVPGVTGATSVQGGQDHVLWLLADGTVKACGLNGNGQLGLGEGLNRSNAAIAIPGLAHIVQISAGNLSSGARDAAGDVYMWGANDFGQAGVNSTLSSIYTPTKVELPAAAVSLSCGGDLRLNSHTLVLLANGLLYGWGRDTHGQLGDEGTGNKLAPVAIESVSRLKLTSVVAAGAYSLGLDASGNVWAWGSNVGGGLGSGGVNSSATPIEVDSGVSSISATAQNSVDIHPAVLAEA